MAYPARGGGGKGRAIMDGMEAAKRALAILLAGTALAAWLALVLTPVFHDGSPEYPVWEAVNWFMAAGAIAALAVNGLRRRALGPDAGTLGYLRASAAWYGSIVLAMLFFWEWFWTLNPGSETGLAVTSHVVYFPIVDALFVVVALATARHLWGAKP